MRTRATWAAKEQLVTRGAGMYATEAQQFSGKDFLVSDFCRSLKLLIAGDERTWIF